MLTGLTNPDEKPNATEPKDGKREPILESSLPSVPAAPAKPLDGKNSTSVMTKAETVMTAEETADLLARLQDCLSLWPGSDNKIMGKYVMTVFPIPEGLQVAKMTKKNGHDKVFCVNGVPVAGLE